MDFQNNTNKLFLFFLIFLFFIILPATIKGQSSNTQQIEGATTNNAFIHGIGTQYYNLPYNESIAPDNYNHNGRQDLFFKIITPYKCKLTANYDALFSEIYLIDKNGNLLQQGRPWEPEDPATGNSTLEAELEKGTYYLVAEGNGIELVAATIYSFLYLDVTIIQEATPSIPAISGINYRQSISYASPIYPGVENLLNIDSMKIDTEYFDDFGRPMQTFRLGRGGQKQDLVGHQVYDSFGRQYQSWIEAPVNNMPENKPVDAKIFFAASKSYHKDSRPYTQVEYESSPLNRVSKITPEGYAWRSKPVTKEYHINTTSGDLACSRYIVEANYNLKRTGNYTAGELYVEKTTDEDGNIAYSFTDKQNRTLLIREMSNGSAHDTHYVYDEYGQVRYVLSPMASEALTTLNGSWNLSIDPTLRNYAYYYYYDEYNRVNFKKLPGADYIEIIYDKADRPIFTRDAETRKRGEWYFTKYDPLGRPILEGIWKTTLNKEALISQYKEIIVTETLAQEIYGYSRNTQPRCGDTGVSILRINYYDKNTLLSQTGLPVADLAYTSAIGYGKEYVRYGDPEYSARGLLTGTREILLNGTGECIKTYYYDDKGQVIQTRATNHLGGIEKEYFRYDFTGNLLAKRHEHSAIGQKTIGENYTFAYDPVGRLLKTTHKIDDATGGNRVLSQQTYDELGRLKNNTVNNLAETITYGYNVRSWTENISSEHFKQNLYYNQSFGGNSPRFNSNISAMTWQTGTDDIRGYTYTYDGLNRLNRATYGEGSALALNKGRYDESIGAYDKNGNILALQRYGLNLYRSGLNQIREYIEIDNLAYEYQGNQVRRVEDAATSLLYSGANDFKNKVNEYWEYRYDQNGNQAKNLNNAIDTIKYNILNLPCEVKIGNSTLSYIYSASGILKRSVTPIDLVSPLSPMQLTMEKDILTNDSNRVGRAAIGPVPRTIKTDYCDNILYKNDALSRILIPGGYVNCTGGTYSYYTYLTDYLGNNRVVVASDGSVLEKNHYYPFGMLFGESVGASNKQPNKLTGKEYTAVGGYNTFDFGARHINPATPAWTTPDPLAEKYFSVSPYTYCANNPTRYVDPDGKDYILIVDPENNRIIVNATYYARTQDINSAQRAVDFWNNQSGKYKYEMKNQNYTIDFSLSVSEVQTDESMNYKKVLNVLNRSFLADKSGAANVYQSVDNSRLEANVNGRTENGNYIKVKESQQNAETGAHEIGHTLGLTHSLSGIMTPSSTDNNRSKTVNNQGVKELIMYPLHNKTNFENGVKAGKGTLQYTLPAFSTENIYIPIP